MKIIAWLAAIIFIEIFFFLIFLLFSKTKIYGEIHLTDSKVRARVLINFLRDFLNIHFDYENGGKRIVFLLGKSVVYQKKLGKETGKKPELQAKRENGQKKKNSLKYRFLMLKRLWQPGRQFLNQFFNQFKFFGLNGDLHLGLGSPSQTGIFYGYWLMLREFIPSSSLVVHPEFLKKEASGCISTDIHVRLVNLVKIVVPFWFKVKKIKNN